MNEDCIVDQIETNSQHSKHKNSDLSTKEKEVFQRHSTSTCESYKNTERIHSMRSNSRNSNKYLENEDDEDKNDDVDDEEEDDVDDWQVWKCKVKVEAEDEGSGIKLFVTSSTLSSSVCVAEFEVWFYHNILLMFALYDFFISLFQFNVISQHNCDIWEGKKNTNKYK